ncbi:MAG TPA: DUF6677 family protein [Terriglobales bacterium]|nr:DUF6677 family protein [Terriglobales bacterium]
MAETVEHTDEIEEKHYPLTAMAVVAPIVGWFIPGGGHFVQKKWIRGALLLVSVVSMFWLGIAMGGKVYVGNAGDLLDILGFVGDAGGGLLYILARNLEWGATSIATASGNYGSIFIIVAGLLNIVSAVDAHEIALGKKP